MEKYDTLLDRMNSARIELDTARAAFKYRYSIVRPPQLPKRRAEAEGARRPRRWRAGRHGAGGDRRRAGRSPLRADPRDLAGGADAGPPGARGAPPPLSNPGVGLISPDCGRIQGSWTPRPLVGWEHRGLRCERPEGVRAR